MIVNRQTTITVGVLLMVVILGALVTYYITAIPRVKEDSPARKALQLQPEEGEYTNLQGETIDLSSHFGKTIIVYSWASWCPQCQTDLPLLSEFAKTVSDEDTVVLAINRSENNVAAQRFLQTLPELPSVEIILDDQDHLFRSMGGFAMPETIVFDENGEIIFHERGPLDIEALSQTTAQQ